MRGARSRRGISKGIPKHRETRTTQKALEQFLAAFLLPVMYLQRNFWPHITWRSQQTRQRHEEGARLKPGRVAEAQTQLDSPISMTLGHFSTTSLTKATRDTDATIPHCVFPVSVLGFFLLLLNGPALLGTVIFPPQLKFEQVALGSSFWKQLQCLLSARAGFYSFNSNLSCPTPLVAVSHTVCP